MENVPTDSDIFGIHNNKLSHHRSRIPPSPPRTIGSTGTPNDIFLNSSVFRNDTAVATTTATTGKKETIHGESNQSGSSSTDIHLPTTTTATTDRPHKNDSHQLWCHTTVPSRRDTTQQYHVASGRTLSIGSNFQSVYPFECCRRRRR